MDSELLPFLTFRCYIYVIKIGVSEIARIFRNSRQIWASKNRSKDVPQTLLWQFSPQLNEKNFIPKNASSEHLKHFFFRIKLDVKYMTRMLKKSGMFTMSRWTRRASLVNYALPFKSYYSNFLFFCLFLMQIFFLRMPPKI